jgi:hypothetical protein
MAGPCFIFKRGMEPEDIKCWMAFQEGKQRDFTPCECTKHLKGLETASKGLLLDPPRMVDLASVVRERFLFARVWAETVIAMFLPGSQKGPEHALQQHYAISTTPNYYASWARGILPPVAMLCINCSCLIQASVILREEPGELIHPFTRRHMELPMLKQFMFDMQITAKIRAGESVEKMLDEMILSLPIDVRPYMQRVFGMQVMPCSTGCLRAVGIPGFREGLSVFFVEKEVKVAAHNAREFVRLWQGLHNVVASVDRFWSWQMMIPVRGGGWVSCDDITDKMKRDCERCEHNNTEPGLSVPCVQKHINCGEDIDLFKCKKIFEVSPSCATMDSAYAREAKRMSDVGNVVIADHFWMVTYSSKGRTLGDRENAIDGSRFNHLTLLLPAPVEQSPSDVYFSIDEMMVVDRHFQFGGVRLKERVGEEEFLNLKERLPMYVGGSTDSVERGNSNGVVNLNIVSNQGNDYYVWKVSTAGRYAYAPVQYLVFGGKRYLMRIPDEYTALRLAFHTLPEGLWALGEPRLVAREHDGSSTFALQVVDFRPAGEQTAKPFELCRHDDGPRKIWAVPFKIDAVVRAGLLPGSPASFMEACMERAHSVIELFEELPLSRRKVCARCRLVHGNVYADEECVDRREIEMMSQDMARGRAEEARMFSATAKLPCETGSRVACLECALVHKEGYSGRECRSNSVARLTRIVEKDRIVDAVHRKAIVRSPRFIAHMETGWTPQPVLGMPRTMICYGCGTSHATKEQIVNCDAATAEKEKELSRVAVLTEACETAVAIGGMLLEEEKGGDGGDNK